MTTVIAGVDEAGRGPLAGPVVAAAVVLDRRRPIGGLMDSKKLTERRRNGLVERITVESLAWAVGLASAAEIDRLNILQASLLAMQRAVEALSPGPDEILVDGLHCPRVAMAARAIVRGDASEPAISAASIIAKVTRDRLMVELDQHYPAYGFRQHKGYPTAAHVRALAEFGPCPEHRRSFAPVRNCGAPRPLT